MNARVCALNALLEQKINSNESLDEKDQRLARNLYWGTLKYYYELAAWLNEGILSKTLKKKERRLQWILLLGLYQIRYLNTPDYVAVNESVKLCKESWQKKLVNACLRKACKILNYRSQALEAVYNHPLWLIKILQKNWPTRWQQILEGNQVIPPNVIRIRDRESWLKSNLIGSAHHNCKSAVVLDKALAITDLPGYESGDCFVQDAASQWAAVILDVQKGQSILDACSAPGGKACHIGQMERAIQLTCIEKDPARLNRLKENLLRAKVPASTICADAAIVEFKEQFDRILLDAPCSAIGIIRRHPDIKLKRTLDDLALLQETQYALLTHLWQFLKIGGKFLYSTCSVLHCENEHIIQRFLETSLDARIIDFELPAGIKSAVGQYLLPGLPAEKSTDGFYYCLIQKIAEE